MEELSKRFNKGSKTLANYRKTGVLNRSRTKKVTIQMWKTLCGYVTTQDAIRDFHYEINT